ncbi:hypothetical protein PVAG01_04074 [Phlyctema vagabunda]|uniref:Ribosomal protein L32 n=1 Tax=Phlyctema vagabunda TaxID=108571 RepID=A0ABR4PNK4_9HELO
MFARSQFLRDRTTFLIKGTKKTSSYTTGSHITQKEHLGCSYY